jgi:hypothetical protein
MSLLSSWTASLINFCQADKCQKKVLNDTSHVYHIFAVEQTQTVECMNTKTPFNLFTFSFGQWPNIKVNFAICFFPHFFQSTWVLRPNSYRKHGRWKVSFQCPCFFKELALGHWASWEQKLSQNFQTFKEPKNRFQGTNSARLCAWRAGTTTLFLLGS